MQYCVVLSTVYSCFQKSVKAYATMPKGSLGNTQSINFNKSSEFILFLLTHANKYS